MGKAQRRKKLWAFGVWSEPSIILDITPHLKQFVWMWVFRSSFFLSTSTVTEVFLRKKLFFRC